MGICWCKEKYEERDSYYPETETNNDNIDNAIQSVTTNSPPEYYLESAEKSCPDSATVDKLILETLSIIGALVDNEQEPPSCMLSLHTIADNEEGWIQVVKSMVNVIPMMDPLGVSVITLLFDDCPLPSRESVLKVVNMFNLSSQSAVAGRAYPPREQNICVVLGCIAEKLAGPNSLKILNASTLDYLITNLIPDTDPYVILFALIALEKFAQTSENKATIIRRLQTEPHCPIAKLESLWSKEEHFVKRQVGFCAEWALDNLFITKHRKFSYLTVDILHNAMLNTSDVSEYLKLSPDGLEARCDAYSFESVRCTAQADSGVWYYEVLIITPGVMQIGWATKDSNFSNHDGYGIGDDKFSLAYDGCRKLIWYNAKSEAQDITHWQPGDILGCLLDLDAQQIIFSVNGISIPPCTHVFEVAKSGYFAAASFMSFQQCRFNFGAESFRFPPKLKYSTFNDSGVLGPEHKKVMPRHIYLNLLRQQSVREDSCTLCYDKKASVRLIPCEHAGFCTSCVSLLSECPMCRSSIEVVIDEPA